MQQRDHRLSPPPPQFTPVGWRSRFAMLRSAARRWAARHPLAAHLAHVLLEQLLAVLPITMLLISTMWFYFRIAVESPGVAIGGLASEVIGLVLFLEGLRVAIMPLAAFIGEQFPRRFPLWCTLLLTFSLGILVTYAEPSIQALHPLAALVEPTRAPYLYFILNTMMEPLVFSVASGVGVAAVLGTLRFVYGWSLKPLIAASLAPTLALSVSSAR